MNPLLKYTFYFICFAVFLLGSNDSISATENRVNEVVTESFNTKTDFTFSDSNDFVFFDSEILHPRSSVTNASRLQNSSRRADSEQKNNYSFIKDGKIVNIGTIFCFHNTFKLKHSFFSEPSTTLIRFGKLII